MKNILTAISLLAGLSIGILGACVDDYDDGGDVECCRVCTSGKPCGDSCIASNTTCNQPPGCACYGDGSDDEN